MEQEKDYSESAMTLIAYSGEARTYAFQALTFAREKDMKQANENIGKAEESLNHAHKAQTELLVIEAKGDIIPVNVLLIHAQDHLMTSMLALELVKELLVLYDVKEDKEER
ncbi:MAG: PTS lactose/cellobiose transporter subunit IIA [Coprobacillaceae bacterium]